MWTIPSVGRGVLILCALLWLGGCGMSVPLIRHQPVEIERLRYVEVPPELTRPTQVPPLAPVTTNAELLAERDALREALNQSNADKQKIATIQGRPIDDERRD